mmetsp:Transcript_8438/g.14140  ORF Transcript_8438/g.14140 Transcript_8438/m.14140 type:complete len:475 (-) Transcript_8438:251-1675(-)
MSDEYFKENNKEWWDRINMSELEKSRNANVFTYEGVEYVDTSARNETMRLFLSQDFFDNIQENLINQLFSKLSGKKFLNITNQSVTLPDIIKIDFNLTNICIHNFSLNKNFTLMDLLDERAIFGVQDFEGQFHADYQYISDPPVFADIGVFSTSINNITSVIDFSTFFDGMFQARINNVTLEMDPFKLTFDGVSDMSDVTARFITFIGNIIRNRLVSINKYLGADNISDMLNTLIAQIPDEIDVPGSDIAIVGGVSDAIHIKKFDYIEIPMDLALQNNSRVMNTSNNVNFAEHEFQGFQIELYLSDYFFRSVIQSFYSPGMKLISTDLPFTTTTLQVLLLGRMSKYGWSGKQPCKMDVLITGDMPESYITEDEGIHITSQLALDLKCKKNEDDDEFSQVFTILTKRIKFTGKIDITGEFVIKIYVEDFNLNIDKIIDSQIGDIDPSKFFKLIIDLFEGTLKTVLNLFFANGFNL